MTEYLGHKFEWGNPEVNWIYDDWPQWSAMCGLFLLQHIPMSGHRHVLDLGCGHGFPSLELAQRLGTSARVVGLDPWADGIRRARQKAQILGITNVEFVEGNALTMPFDDGAFDLITSNVLINNLTERAAVASECFRVAAPNALLCWGTNLRGNMAEFYDVFERVLRRLDRRAALQKLQAHIEHRVTVDELNQEMIRAGFKPTRTKSERVFFRFHDGSSMLRHFIIKEAFLDDWRRLLEPSEEAEVFAQIEAELNRSAQVKGELALSIPIAYVEARKA